MFFQSLIAGSNSKQWKDRVKTTLGPAKLRINLTCRMRMKSFTGSQKVI